jgi:hypothetical protein
MESVLPVLVGDAPEALIELCGVNLLERLLRILQRLGFRHAIVCSTTPELVGTELAKRSWARDKVIVDVVPRAIGPLTAQLLSEYRQIFIVTRACLPLSARKVHLPRLSIPIRRNSQDL